MEEKSENSCIDKIRVCIVHFNTPELTSAAARSILKHSDRIKDIVIFDNSNKRPFVIPRGLEDKISVIDNTKGSVLDLDSIIAQYKNRVDDHISNFGSARHALSIQWLIDNINEPFILTDSDILVFNDIYDLVDRDVVWAGKTLGYFRPRGDPERKPRAEPYLCFLNTDIIKKHGIRYFDGNRMILLGSRNVPYEYDTGASFYEDCQKLCLKHNEIDINNYMYHLASASWASRDVYGFLNKNRQLFDYKMNEVFSGIKILVCHHLDKPIMQEYKDDMYINLHGGRKIYTGNSSILLGMKGDDTGNNISSMNLDYNELTCVYYAWRNYNEIGNPDYIGLNHYRRIFDKSMISDYNDYDIIVWDNILVRGFCGNLTVRQQFERCHGQRPIKNLFDYIDELGDPKYDFVKQSFEGRELYSKNMFIMRKHVFFEYCELLFPLILGMAKNFIGNENFRDRGFISERVSSAIFKQLSIKYRTKFLPIPKHFV